MSAEATAALFEHAKGSDAEWRMLAYLTNAANADGVVVGVTMAALTKVMEKSERATAQVKRRLIDSGQLVVLEQGAGRGHPSSYWVALPGLKGPVETPQDPVERLKRGTGSGGGGSSNGEKETTSSSDREANFVEELRDVEIPPEMIAEGKALLREKRKVGSHLVTPGEMARAAAGLATFNRLFEWKSYNGIRKGADFGLGPNLKSIVMRVRDRPTWDPPKHVRLVESAWRIRWWERTGKPRRPEPNVIYSPKTFDRIAQDAKEEKESGGISRPARKYTRSRTRGR